MVMKLLLTNTIGKIKKSFGRYLSIFAIVLVGVGFFAGIQASAPDIAASLGSYNRTHRLMDFQVVSTMGLTDADVAALKALANVSDVIPSDSLDVSDQGKAIRVQAIENSVSTVQLRSGRMPQTDEECVADRQHYRLGDTVRITSDVSGKLKHSTFTVVGTVQSPQYLSYDYGNTTVGDGKLSSFIYVTKSNFTLDAYTEILIRVSGAKSDSAYSKQYAAIVSRVKSALVQIKPEREAARYQEIYNQAAQKIQDGESTLNSEKAAGEKQLAEAKAELDRNARKLETAQTVLDRNETKLQKEEQTQNASFQSAKEQIANGRSQIQTALQSGGLTEEQLEPQMAELNSAIQSLKGRQSELKSGSSEFAQLETQITQYTASYQELQQLQANIDALNAKETQLDQGIAAFEVGIAQAKQQMAAGSAQLLQNKRKLDDGYAEYDRNLSAFQSKIADAASQLQDARRKLADIEKPQWTILDRNAAVPGYSDVKSGSDVIVSVSMLFPFFFILIVLLMTSNTMARMIAEERSEIGTLTSLGFRDGRIISTYLLYVLSATVLGSGIGFFAGCALIPQIVYACFPYILPALKIQYNIPMLLCILAVAVVLMTSVTVCFCRRELAGKPAALMRPVPPKGGQKVLLEKVGFLWKRLSFTWKVTMRNMFRYKSRALMTIIGIAGCTTLLLTGFGIKDSTSGIVERQFGHIFRYDDLLVLKNETQSMGAALQDSLARAHVTDPVLLRQTALTCEENGKSLDAYLIVPENDRGFSRYFHLDFPKTGQTISLDSSGVIISQKLSETYRVGKGGRIRVKDADSHVYTLSVSDVAENHIQNYIYMEKDLYQKIFGKAVSYNMIASDYTGSQNGTAESLIGSGQIVSVNFRAGIVQQAIVGNQSLNNVVILLVCVASILILIVLYNLTSINISEREREIATLKVLGFCDRETNAYIYRETFVLNLMSIGIGLIAGIGLHRLVMAIINANTAVLYFTAIHPISFLWTFLIAMAGSIIMLIITYLKLRTVDMIQSLKSVE